MIGSPIFFYNSTHAGCNSEDGTLCSAKTAPTVKAPSQSDLDSGTYAQKTYYYYKPTPTDCEDKLCVIQHVKGSIKNGDGIYMIAQMYGRATEINFDDWLVDSHDTDPKATVTKSSTHEAWYYYYDRPGPATSSKKGYVFTLDFRTGIFCMDEIPSTVSMSEKPNLGSGMKSYSWAYKIKVKDDGSFETF